MINHPSEEDGHMPDSDGLMTFGGHIGVLRRMLVRIIIVVASFGCIIFCFKGTTFDILLAPNSSDFVTYQTIEKLLGSVGIDFHFVKFHIPLISTELSSQFMTHIYTSCILAVLLASPYIVFELFRFVSPALYESEKRYSYLVVSVVYGLFVIGLMMSYFILFPISFQFLATYQVDESVVNTITLDSYISTFTTLTFMMGVVFQMPVIAFVVGKMGLISARALKKYRAYAFVIILILAAIITPPDILTLIIVAAPLYALYEVSIMVVNRWGKETESLVVEDDSEVGDDMGKRTPHTLRHYDYEDIHRDLRSAE